MENEKTKKDRNKAFGARLKGFRQNKKLTQEALSEQVGKSAETISKLERGLIYPGVDMLIHLAEVLDTSLDALVGHESNNKLSQSHAQLLANVSATLNNLDEKKLKVAAIQLKALSEL